MYDFKFQIASMAVMAIIVIAYFINEKLPLMSTKIFSAFMIVSACELFFDMATVYTINHLDSVSPMVNRLFHQFFIGSLDVAIYLLYLYVVMHTNHQKRMPLWEIGLRSVPLAIAMLMVVFAPLYYNVESKIHYSYGPMATTVYVSIAIYIVLIPAQICVHREDIAPKKKHLIYAGLGLWAALALVQLFHPTVLISSLGLTLMVILVFLSFENPKEFADNQVEALNRQAYHTVMADMIASKRRFYVVSIVIDNARYIQDVMGFAEISNILNSIIQSLRSEQKMAIYHSRSNVLSIFVEEEHILTSLEQAMNHWNEKCQRVEEAAFQPTYHMDVIECPKYASTEDDIYYLMDYMNARPGNQLVCSLDDEMYEEIKHFHAIEDLVDDAIRNDGFEVFYQPIYSNQTHTFSSAEALVRLKDSASLGYISPEVFIPIAEQKGMIKQLGNIVFEKVCRFASEQKLWELGVHYIEVNISGIQGMDRGLPETLQTYMEQYKIEPSFINLEITETAAVGAGEILQENMQKLRNYGCHFSMDDFGTGYSNLSQMVTVQFELIKLDKSLIWPAFDQEHKEAEIILDSCIQMINQLNMHIVAEGVETKEQMEALSAKGVTYLQGYYFSRPICEGHYLQYLQMH